MTKTGRPPLDLAQVSGAEGIKWLAGAFGQRRQNTWPHRETEVNLDVVLPFLRVGVTRTDLIETHAEHATVLDTLPDGHQLHPDNVADFLLVGGPAWVGDPENRSEWVQIGRLAARHAALMAEHASYVRYGPDGKPRYHGLAPHEAVTAFYTAGRGPAYARKIIAIAERHLAEIDAFGFGEEITVATYADLLAAGVRNRADLAGYLHCGLDLAEAIAFRHDDIPPAAVLMAKREGLPREKWRETLAPLPAQWFRDLGTNDWPDEETPNLLRMGGNDRYTLADLKFLWEWEWDGEDRLSPAGFRVPDDQIAATARELAKHGLTWTDAERWATALTVGKAPDPRYRRHETTTAPLLRGGGRGAAKIDLAHLPDVLALANAGIKPSHLATYRKAGCDSIERILDARRRGITAAVAEALLREHGRKPSDYKTTRLFDSYEQLLRAYDRHREEQSA